MQSESASTQAEETLERIVNSTTINVGAWILFMAAKYFTSFVLLYISLGMFVLNAIITIAYFKQWVQQHDRSSEYSRIRNKFLMRLTFMSFFLLYGTLMLTGTLNRQSEIRHH